MSIRKQILYAKLSPILVGFPYELVRLIVAFDHEWHLLLVAQRLDGTSPPYLHVFNESSQTLTPNPISLPSWVRVGRMMTYNLNVFCGGDAWELFCSESVLLEPKHDENSSLTISYPAFTKPAKLFGLWAPTTDGKALVHISMYAVPLVWSRWPENDNRPIPLAVKLQRHSRIAPLPAVYGQDAPAWILVSDVKYERNAAAVLLLDLATGKPVSAVEMPVRGDVYPEPATHFIWSVRPILQVIFVNPSWEVPIWVVSVKKNGHACATPTNVPRFTDAYGFSVFRINDMIAVSDRRSRIRLYNVDHREPAQTWEVYVQSVRSKEGPLSLVSPIFTRRAEQSSVMIAECAYSEEILMCSPLPLNFIDLVALPEPGLFASPTRYGLRLWKLQNVYPDNDISKQSIAVPVPFRDVMPANLNEAHCAKLLLADTCPAY